MLINIYNTKDHTYMSLNLNNIGFKDIFDLFQLCDFELKILSKQNQKIFDEITHKTIFNVSGVFLSKVYDDLKFNKIKSNNIFILEYEDLLYYLPINIESFVMIEGLASLMINTNSVSVSQKLLLNLNNE